MPDSLVAVSFNFENTPIDLRDRLDLSDEEARAFIEKAMADTDFISELGVISTCNRTEIYALLTEQDRFLDWIVDRFSETKNIDLDLNENRPWVLHGDHAVKHILGVAGGLKSMMLGENQILGQVKSSYELLLSMDHQFPVLNRLFQEAIRAGKSIRTNTGLCKGAASISLAAAGLARKIFANFSDLRVLLVGAGETAELTAVHFKELGVVDFIIANRGKRRRMEMARKFDARPVGLDELEQVMPKASIVVTATKSPDHLLTVPMMQTITKARRHATMLLIDISSPRNIDPAVGNISELYLYNIDDLKKIVADNLEKRKKEIPAARRIVDEIADDFREWFKTLEVVPTISKLSSYFEHIRNQELNKYVHKTGTKEFEFMKDLSRSIIKKLLHYPISELREQNNSGNLNVSKIDALWELYHLREFEKEEDD